MAVEDSSAQSDDTYDRTMFRRLADGSEVPGTVGWREGGENRVSFSVWDGPSFASNGRDLHAAFRDARAGIEAQGFVPLLAGARAVPPDQAHDLFEPAAAAEVVPLAATEDDERDDTPGKFEPRLWLLLGIVVLALLWPVFARAEIPVTGRTVPFPNAPYAWRYDGPDFSASSSSDQSAAQPSITRDDGRASPGHDPRITIVDGASGEDIAHYVIAGGSFCDHGDCELDGIFPIVLSGHPTEPVLGVVAQYGAQGQKLFVFRPLKNNEAPVFEAIADYALILKLLPGGLFVEMERADKTGNITRDMQMWLTGDDAACTEMPAVGLPSPPPPSEAAAALETELRRIARTRDLHAFVELLTDDVLVSFGGSGGKDEFLQQHLGPHESGNEMRFWQTLDRMLAHGAWNDRSDPESMTWPWFFTAWPHDAEAYDIFIARPDTPLRAGPDDMAPLLATLPFGALRYQAPDQAAETVDWRAVGWLPVAAPGHCLGYVRADDVTPLLGTRMIARRIDGAWKIEAFVSGD